MKINRRNVLKSSLALLGSTALAGRLRAEDGPIRIGGCFPLSGPAAVLGQVFHAGAIVGVNQINQAGGVNGRKIELVVRDDKASPTEAITSVLDLISNGVQLMMGGQFTASTTSILPAIKDANVVFV